MTHHPTARHVPGHSEVSAGTRSLGRMAGSSQSGTHEAVSPLKGTLKSLMLFHKGIRHPKTAPLLLLLCSQTAGKFLLLPPLP